MPYGLISMHDDDDDLNRLVMPVKKKQPAADGATPEGPTQAEFFWPSPARGAPSPDVRRHPQVGAAVPRLGTAVPRFGVVIPTWFPPSPRVRGHPQV